MEVFKNSRVAIVDGDQTICKSLTEMIRRWGLRAENFTRLEAALEDIRGNRCDIILLDICICDMYGLDQILHACNDMKVIIITGQEDKDRAIRTFKLGVFDFVEEPFRTELLHHSILRALTVLENERKSKRLVDYLEQSRSELLDQQQRLEKLNTHLLDTNRALAIFAQNIECEQEEIEKRIALKLRNLIIPMVVRLGSDPALQKFEPQLDMLARQVEDLTSGFAVDPGVAVVLSFAELQVASLIKNGVTTEEIARQLNIAESTVRTHRKNIRKKLKIKNSQFSLRNFLYHHANYKG